MSNYEPSFYCLSLIPTTHAQAIKYISASIFESHSSSYDEIIDLPQVLSHLTEILLIGFTLLSQAKPSTRIQLKWPLTISFSPSLPHDATCLILM